MKKTALLFSGQGAQSVGMGKDLAAEFPAAAALFEKADSILGYPLSRIAFEGPSEELTKTSVCQPALYVHRAMQEACEASTGGMAAIIGGEEDRVRELAAAADVDVANINAPGQIVLSGEASKIIMAVSLAKEYSARKAVELTVAGAFHSRLMEPAYQSLSIALAETQMLAPRVPVVCNVDAIEVRDPQTIRRTLADQVTGSVCWSQSIEYLIDRLHIEQFIELGPGGVIAGLVGRIRKGTPITSVSNVSTLEEAVAFLSA
jgi:[acyl-carrier-protein] S-malonyltransferase